MRSPRAAARILTGRAAPARDDDKRENADEHDPRGHRSPFDDTGVVRWFFIRPNAGPLW
jgi:hypothetical protein